MHIAVVSARPTAALAALTVRHASRVVPDAVVVVLDVDGSYVAVGGEEVVGARDVVGVGALHQLAMVTDPRRLGHALQPSLLRALPRGSLTLTVDPGVVLLASPTALIQAAERRGLGLLSRVFGTAMAGPGAPWPKWPTARDAAQDGAYAPGMIATLDPDPGVLDLWSGAHIPPEGSGDRWLDLAAAALPHETVRDQAALVSPWSLSRQQELRGSAGRPPAADPEPLTLDGRPVSAVDLSRLDPHRPWLLDQDVRTEPEARMSDHPALARFVADVAADLRAAEPDIPPGEWDPQVTASGVDVHDQLRLLYRAARTDHLRHGTPLPPDPFDPTAVDQFLDWLTEPWPTGGPSRYLRSIYDSRPDLRSRFPHVPGEHTGALVEWARRHGRAEPDYSAALIERSVQRQVITTPVGAGPRAHGVNLIGYLRGELGIGESARLVGQALDAAGIAHAAVPIDVHLASRQTVDSPAPVRPSAGTQAYDTSLICVNADMTSAVASAVPRLLDRSYRIGMWYWEVEDFPATQHGGFAHVDEVWTATDFVREAIEPHSPVPVRTVTPPLPQRGPTPVLTRDDLGLPDRPIFLFSFDYLSTVERKNPLGLVDAFTAAFARGEGPVLVIKSINADQRPAEAERLRLRVAELPDVMLMEAYLSAAERDALVALCDCYVSLHRSEGLGLTMAEAMAWAKPVIATGYSGNLQFMTEENSYLVPWTPATIPSGAEPYPAGGRWADPDLAAAAAMMRAVIADPETARAKGARAAADIATLHSPEVAGRRITERLAESAKRRRTVRRGTGLITRARRAAGRRLLG